MDDAIKIVRAGIQNNLVKALNDKDIQNFNAKMKADYATRSKKGVGQANWRLIGSYPIEVRALLVAKYGPSALKDESFYKEFMKSDEMSAFRAVPITEI